MQNWRKYRNYRKYTNTGGSFTYVIRVDGRRVEVSEEIYTEYASSARRIEYMEHDLKRSRVLQDADGKAVRDENGQPVILPEREVSLEKLIGGDWEYASAEPSPEDDLIARHDIDALRAGLALLGDAERALITALFFEGLTEREYSARSGIPQKTVNDRKHRILGKLKKYFQK